MSNDTPRTDAEAITACGEMEFSQYVNADLARELERELNALKASHEMNLDYTEPPRHLQGLPDDFRRIALLFTSRCTRTKFAKGEKKAWESVTIKEHELVELEWFYSLDKSTEYDQTWHRKGQPAALLNNLDAQLDLAFEHKEALRKKEPKLGTAPQW